MSNIILARLGASYDRRADRRVHSFEAVQDSDDGIRKAFCGFAAHHSVLEPMSAFTGAGCELCIANAPLAAEESSADIAWPPEDDPVSTALYAVGLRAESVWHRVPEHPVIRAFEGREAVITECGRIGYLVFGSPPEGYESCADCTNEYEDSK